MIICKILRTVWKPTIKWALQIEKMETKRWYFYHMENMAPTEKLPFLPDMAQGKLQ